MRIPLWECTPGEHGQSFLWGIERRQVGSHKKRVLSWGSLSHLSSRQSRAITLQLICHPICMWGQNIACPCRSTEVAAVTVSGSCSSHFQVCREFGFVFFFFLNCTSFHGRCSWDLFCISSRYLGSSFISSQLNVIVASFWSAHLFVPIKKILPL